MHNLKSKAQSLRFDAGGRSTKCSHPSKAHYCDLDCCLTWANSPLGTLTLTLAHSVRCIRIHGKICSCPESGFLKQWNQKKNWQAGDEAASSGFVTIPRNSKFVIVIRVNILSWFATTRSQHGNRDKFVLRKDSKSACSSQIGWDGTWSWIAPTCSEQLLLCLPVVLIKRILQMQLSTSVKMRSL